MTSAAQVLSPPSPIHTLKALISLRQGVVSIKVIVHRQGLWIPCGFLELAPVEWLSLERAFRAEGVWVEYINDPTQRAEDSTI